MSNTASSYLNKNSAYINSLVSFILDTKPYHCKLTEIVEEYQFNDEMHVTMQERLIWRAKFDSHWNYEFYSSGNSNVRSAAINRLFSYLFDLRPYIVGVDEDPELGLAPHTYDKRHLDGEGVANVRLDRDGFLIPLTEAVDFHHSLGAFEFQLKQHINAKGVYDPLWGSTMDDNLLREAYLKVRATALDTANPDSNVNQLIAIMNRLRDEVNALGGDATVDAEIQRRLDILAVPNLPSTYEALYNAIAANSALDPIDMDQYKDEIRYWSPAIFFGDFSDLSLREGGLVFYSSVITDAMNVINISMDVNNPNYQEWTLRCVDVGTRAWAVYGSVTGFAGQVKAGSSFTAQGITFTTVDKSAPALNQVITLTPGGRVTMHPTAPLETWNVIKTPPVAYSRPILDSVHYGRIYDLSGVLGQVSLIDKSMPASTFTIEYIGEGQFLVTNNQMPDYRAFAMQNEVFNDGVLGFIIRAGLTPFNLGERFVIDVENEGASVLDLNVTFGYDTDAYDNDHLEDNLGRKIGFYYESRYPNYDLNSLNVHVEEVAQHKRKFRAVAVPDKSKPIATLKKDGSGPSEDVDLDDATSGIAPDPALNAPPKYKMDPAQSEVNLQLFYASEFQLMYSDDDFATFITLGTIPVGGSWADADLGVSFQIPAVADHPYIGVSAYDGEAYPRVESGDIVEFMVWNPDPEQVNKPTELITPYAPRLNMHASGFYWAPAADWTVDMVTETTYTVNAIYTEGPLKGLPMGAPFQGTTLLPGTGAREGFSFNGGGVLFTIMPNNGLHAGDKFYFSTFTRKPTYQVYGSVSGWQKPYVLGEWYWNGKIGFKLSLPTSSLYDSRSNLVSNNDVVKVSKLRQDHDYEVYTFTKSSTGFMISSGKGGTVGYLPSTTNTFENDHIKFEIVGDVSTLLTTGNTFKVMIEGHKFELFNGHDLVFLKTTSPGRRARADDKVLITKTEDSRLGISIDPLKAPDVQALMPEAIDPRIIDLDTNSEIPVTATSPELAVLTGWIPYFHKRLDSQTSIAEFYDPATISVYFSAATGEKIGTVQSLDPSNPTEPVRFEWDEAFFKKYLPTNARTNLVPQNSGWCDTVKVHIAESLKMLTNAGGFDEDFSFEDRGQISFNEKNFWYIDNYYNKTMSVVVKDGPFNGFVPGFGNTEFDEEGYDEGQPPDIYSLLAKHSLSDDERNAILLRWNNFLEGGDTVPTTQQQWDYYWNGLATDPNPGTTTVDEFGIPNVGLGIDYVGRNSATANSAIVDSMQMLVTENGSSILVAAMGAVPTTASAPASADWDSWSPYFTASMEAQSVEFTFPAAVTGTIQVRVWERGNAGPVVSTDWTRVNNRKVVVPLLTAVDLVKIDITKT